MTEEEYLELIQKYFAEQYSDNYSFDDEYLEEDYFCSSPKKETVPDNKTINLTDCNKKQIKESLGKYHNIIVSDFIIKINKYYGEPTQSEPKIYLDLSIYETVHKNFRRVDISKDKRFYKFRNISKAMQFGILQNIPMDDVVDIIVWCQKINKLKAFL